MAAGRPQRPGALFHPLDPLRRRAGLAAHRHLRLPPRRRWTRFNAAPPSPLEQREKLEQLRALELGLSIWAAVVDAAPISVDNPADLEAARASAEATRMTKGRIAFQGELGANSDEACRAALPRL